MQQRIVDATPTRICVFTYARRPIVNFTPILLDIAEQFESARLVMRAAAGGDGAAHFAAVSESIVDLRAHLGHLPWVSEEPSLANSERYCRTQRSNFIQRQNLVFFMFTKTDRQLVGSIGLHRIDWEVPRVEIGYWCRTSAQGKGYVVEAVHAITDYAFSQLAAKRVEIRADDLNARSWKVAENCGFHLEGVLRQFNRDAVSNQLCDLRVYSKIA